MNSSSAGSRTFATIASYVRFASSFGNSRAVGSAALPSNENPRTGVDRVTWNVKGVIQWRSQLTDRFGLQIGVRATTNLLVGEVPMLELKRSMIDEPMAMGTLGAYFTL